MSRLLVAVVVIFALVAIATALPQSHKGGFGKFFRVGLVKSCSDVCPKVDTVAQKCEEVCKWVPDFLEENKEKLDQFLLTPQDLEVAMKETLTYAGSGWTSKSTKEIGVKFAEVTKRLQQEHRPTVKPTAETKEKKEKDL